MKSFRIDDEEALSDESVVKAIKNASKRKKSRKDVQRILADMEATTEAMQQMAWEMCFSPRKHTPSVINEGGPGKPRRIIKPDYYPEQIMHHVVVQALQPCVKYGMTDFVLGSIPGRGAHHGKKIIEDWLRNDEKNTRIIGKLDIRHFYESIDHDVLRRWIHKKIRPGIVRDICDIIIEALKMGIPLGFYTSQWFSNFLLQPLDHKISEELHIPHSARYMDDIVLFGSSKKVVHAAMAEIDRYLWEEFGLQVKSNWQVFRMEYVVEEYAIECRNLRDLYALDKALPVRHKLKQYKGRRKIFVKASAGNKAAIAKLQKRYGATVETIKMIHGRPLDFMGFLFHRDRTTLRKSIMVKTTRTASRIGRAGKINWVVASRMLSYMGWITHTDTYKLYLDRIKPHVSVRRMRRIVSKHQRRKNAHGTDVQARKGHPGGEACGN